MNDHDAAGPSPPPRSGLLWGLLALSGIGALVPWLTTYWLFDHGSNNLAATHILQSLAASPDSVFAQHFTEQLRIAPYSLLNWLLLALSSWVGLVDAHRIIVSALALAMPLTVYFALGRLAPDRRINALLYAPLGMTSFSGAGMQGFGLCLPPMLAAWALVCGPPAPGGRRTAEVATAAMLLLIATFAHPAGPVLGAIAIALFHGRRLLRPHVLAEAALALLPACLWLVTAELASRSLRGGAPGYTELVWLDTSRAVHYFLIAFTVTSKLEAVARIPIFGILAWGLVRGLAHDRAQTLPFARIALCFLALLVLGPAKISDATVSHRFAVLLVTFACFGVVLPPILGRVRTSLVVLATALAVAAVQLPFAREADRAIDDVIAVGAHIPRGATVLPISFARPDTMRSYRFYFQPWSYLVITRDIITPYLPASGALGQSGHEFRALAYKRPPSAEHLPAPIPRHAIDDSCKLLELSSSEDCAGLRALRYRSYAQLAATYDRALVLDPPPEFVAELSRAMTLDERRGSIWLFRPRP
ncbi:MAG TPA: hypothetical protein VNO30_47405 [Kofleriaceae bacterium]|nr:hypothetical protein [Kofleriaceae bacterium]